MTVGIIGGRGFVGEAVTEHVSDRYHSVTIDPSPGADRHRQADITDPEQAVDAVEGCDTVINLAGLTPLRQPRGTTYHAVQVDGVENVIAACEKHGIEQLVHMSALGADPDSDITFIRTKGIGEQRVVDSGLDVTVFRPSMIFDRGNQLIRIAARTARLRLFPDLPMRVQPVYRQDVAALFQAAVDGDIAEEVVDVGGPDKMMLHAFVAAVYNAQGYRCYPVPVPGLRYLLTMMEYVPFMPWGRDQAGYLGIDNTTTENDAARYIKLTAYQDWVQDTF